MPQERNGGTGRTLRGRMARFLVRTRSRVPPGLRLVLGLLLIAGGIVGFLPVLGFWMIPLGVMVAALDVKPLVRRFRGDRRTPPKSD
ncbi:hypothetical protein QO034_12100 [Sedimentitalea sp. JM2-8]|uniref:Transmembrane protein (PGPGW) n=1 Tax=Sedimentitalea xiamensis TaxID=3050037 RepID=A0ABT7FFF1_9RHOB|nr:hypothetical protein [Sedimentitalea xiamensis]MDK3073856.1 hypothetical protein [Sedimentitalea xiamensis]